MAGLFYEVCSSLCSVGLFGSRAELGVCRTDGEEGADLVFLEVERV
jgi:hypothetical protein